MRSLLIILSLALSLFANTAAVNSADELASLYDISVGPTNYQDSLYDKEIKFYAEDLQATGGIAYFRGGMESEDDDVPLEELFVEITIDGGETWHRASGHANWEWSFRPESGQVYLSSIRVVRVTSQNATPTDGLTIGGFLLALDEGTSVQDALLSGSGSITIPYLETLTTLSNTLPVTLDALAVRDGRITSGQVELTTPFTIKTDLADVAVTKIIIDANPQDSHLEGRVTFKGVLASVDAIDLPSSMSLLPERLSISLPFDGLSVDIWSEHGVTVAVTEGSLGFEYTVGAQTPQVTLEMPKAKLHMGTLLTDMSSRADSIVLDLSQDGSTYTASLSDSVKFLDTGIELTEPFTLGLDLKSIADPKLSFASNVNITQYENPIVNGLEKAAITVAVSKRGLDATVTLSDPLSSVTLIDRGDDANDVKLDFTGSDTSFKIVINNSDLIPKLSFPDITAEISFGDLLQNSKNDVVGTADPVVVALHSVADQSQHYTLSLAGDAYLMGSALKLPAGMIINVDLENINYPKLTFSSSIDLSGYENILISSIDAATITAVLSKSGFKATVTASSSLDPIVLLERGGTGHDVRILFDDTITPTFILSASSTTFSTSLDMSDFSAKVDFGDLLNVSSDLGADAPEQVMASLRFLDESSSEIALNFANLPKVTVLESALALSGLQGSFNLDTKAISIESSVDLDGYDNPVLKALSGASMSVSISSSGFDATMEVQDGLEPIVILDRGADGQDVVMTIAGEPTVHVGISSSGPTFDFGTLDASLDFGDLLQSEKNRAAGNFAPVIAALQKLEDTSNTYTFKLDTDIYLLGSDLTLKGVDASFDLNTKKITLNSTVDLSAYSNPVIKALDGATISSTVSPSGFSGTLSKSDGIEPIVILERGGSGKDVALEFTEVPVVTLALKNNSIDFDIEGGSAELAFGALLEDAKASLTAMRDKEDAVVSGRYSWSIEGSKKLMDNAQARLSGLSGEVDLRNIYDPKVIFNADVDLSGYGGVFSATTPSHLSDAVISKRGLSAALTVALGSIDIYEQKQVKLRFTKDPQIRLALLEDKLKLSFSTLSAEIDFGTMLDGAVASIEHVVESEELSRLREDMESFEETLDGYRWYLDGAFELADSGVVLSGLSGTIDLDDFTNPSIVINANANLQNYGGIFKYVRSAGIEGAKISRSGFKGDLVTTLEAIDIWTEKNVKLVFSTEKPPRFHLEAGLSGVKVGVSDLDAELHMGSLLNNSIASLSSAESDMYSWSLSGTQIIAESKLALSGLRGKVDLSDLRNPVIDLNATADLSAYGGPFETLESVSLENTTISRNGFSSDLHANIGDIDIWADKEVKLSFAEGTSPTLHVAISATKFSVGLSDMDADIAFGQLLSGEHVHLSGLEVPGEYSWSLQDQHTLINDDNGQVTVDGMQGHISLDDLTNPVIVFGAEADFTHYEFPVGHLESATLEDAKISRSGIDWNLVVTGAGTEVTILDLGTKDEDVRLELANVGAKISNTSASITAADGILYFGKLFDGDVDPVTLTYSEEGRYTFSTPQVFTYKDGDNSVVLSGLSGEVLKVGSSYKVTLQGESEIHATILQQIGLGTISIDDLEVSSAGLKGDITSSWNPRKQITIVNGKAILELSEVGVHIDSSREMPISLVAFAGDIDVSELFDEANEAAKAALAYADNSVSWTFSDTMHIRKFAFAGLGGTLSVGSLNDLSIGLSGTFSYSELPDLSLEMQAFSIRPSGLYGTVGMGSGSSLALGSEALKLTAFSTTFGDNISGHAALSYDSDSFLGSGKPLELNLAATVDETGIREFTLEGSDMTHVKIDGFAEFAFSEVSTSPSFSNMWINLDGTIKPDHALFKASNGVEFQDLKISRTGITVANAGVEFDVSGADATLGGLDLSLEKVGIGFEDELFYMRAKGGLALMGIEAGAGVKLYSDMHLAVDSIRVLVNKPGLSLGGEVAWYQNDTRFGNGFSADGLQLRIAEAFSVKGSFQIGKVNNYLYWRGQAQGGVGPSGIPFGALSIYELGGGVAHNMAYVNKEFVPQHHNDMLLLATLIGTQDLGYVWHGQLDLQLNSSGQINLYGTTYVLSNIGAESQDRKITADIEIGLEPATIHIAVDAKIKYSVIGVEGSSDIMLSPSEKHLYVGTDKEFVSGFNVTEDLGHVTVTAFGFNANGYFMVDSRQLAFGLGYELDEKWEKDWVGCNPKLTIDLEARADALLRYNPFFMKVGASADAELEGCYCACLGVDAHVLMELGAPRPSYLYAEASVTIDPPGPGDVSTHFSGYIYGSGKDSADDDQPKFLDHIEPYNETELSVMPQFKLLLLEVDGASVDVKKAQLRNVDDGSIVTMHRSTMYYYDESDGRPGYVYFPNEPLEANSNYLFEGDLVIKDNNMEVTEHFSKHYKTTERFAIAFDEIVTHVTPENMREDVPESERVTIHYAKMLMDGLGPDNELIKNFSIEVLNSKNVAIHGTYVYRDTGDHKVSEFIPSTPMRIYHYCVSSSGEVRETFLDEEGRYRNPFRGYHVDGDYAEAQANVVVPATVSLQNLRDVDLGRFVRSSEDEQTHETYSYYTNNAYKIVVTDTTLEQIVYYSTFKIAWNDYEAEGLRRLVPLQEFLRPKLVLHDDEDSDKEIRIEVDRGLRAAGITSNNIVYKIHTIWEIESAGGVVREEIDLDYSEMGSGAHKVKFDGDIVGMIPGTISYYERRKPETILLTIPYGFANGESYSSAQEAEIAAKMEEARRGDKSDVIRGGADGVIPTFPGRGGGAGSPDDAPDGVPGRDESGGGWNGVPAAGGGAAGGWETVPVSGASGGFRAPAGAAAGVDQVDAARNAAAGSGHWGVQSGTRSTRTQQNNSYNHTAASNAAANAAQNSAREGATRSGTHFRLGQ